MEVLNLSKTSLEELLECFYSSFANYFVEMPVDEDYYRRRFKAARVDWNYSYGMFDQGKMIGFIIHGIDVLAGFKTAFNTGTGVIPAYRGQSVVDKIYDHALSHLKEIGIQLCALEVIKENAKAIRVYERIGFEIKRDLRCYKGEIGNSDLNVQLEESGFDDIQRLDMHSDSLESWDHVDQAIKIAGSDYRCFKVYEENNCIGYFVINPERGTIGQMGCIDGKEYELFDGIKKINSTIRIDNVDARREKMISAINHIGLQNNVDQYEMWMKI